jgi:hypothetical protein
MTRRAYERMAWNEDCHAEEEIQHGVACGLHFARQAIEADKLIYREEPIVDTLDKAVVVARGGGLPKFI